MQGTPVNIIVGSQVWVEDPELAWIDGEVIEIKGNDATIVTTNERKVMFSFIELSLLLMNGLLRHPLIEF